MTRRSHGGLEDEVLRRLWAYDEPVTSRQLWEAFEEELRPARTTLLTVLGRLEAKGLVQRQPATGGARFSGARTDVHDAARAMTRTLDRVTDRGAALTQFAGELDANDLEVLRRALDGDGPP